MNPSELAIGASSIKSTKRGCSVVTCTGDEDRSKLKAVFESTLGGS